MIKINPDTIIFPYYFWVIDHLNDANQYSYLLEMLFKLEYTTCENVPLDLDRIEDAREFIEIYLRESEYPTEHTLPIESGVKCKILMNRIPSVLEVLIAMSVKICNFIGDDIHTPEEWFWLFLENLGIRIPDTEFFMPGVEDCIRLKIDRFLKRAYDENGDGSMFPSDIFHRKKINCRTFPLWDQCFLYISDLYFSDL